MIRRFFDFYRECWADVNERKIGDNMWLLFNRFTAWLEKTRNEAVPEQTEKTANIAMSRSLPSLGEFCAIYEAAAEQLIWETQRLNQQLGSQRTLSPPLGGETEGD
jgi:hypothetical protein